MVIAQSKYDLPDISANADILDFCTNIRNSVQSISGPFWFEGQDVTFIRKTLFINKGWRLTYGGVLQLAYYFKSYSISNIENQTLTAKVLLNIDSCINSPWYVGSKGKVTLFDSIPFFELSMFDGNLNNFIKSIAVNLR
jgi:hypothetical protein